MGNILVMLLVVATSVAAYCTTQRMQPARSSIQAAVRALLDFVGAFVVFLALNTAIGVVAILAIRELTTVFIPLYTLSNLLLPILSAAQGFIFHAWWRHE
jgi:hypothetical protein